MMQNPQFMDMIMASNPMLGNNPEMRQMMQTMMSNPGAVLISITGAQRSSLIRTSHIQKHSEQ